MPQIVDVEIDAHLLADGGLKIFHVAPRLILDDWLGEQQFFYEIGRAHVPSASASRR
jgi:hypothetical protein